MFLRFSPLTQQSARLTNYSDRWVHTQDYVLEEMNFGYE